MKAPTQIKPPDNWQDFETLCMKFGAKYGIV